jgi:hypothetical protein
MVHRCEHGDPDGVTHLIGIRATVIIGKSAAWQWVMPSGRVGCPGQQLGDRFQLNAKDV